MALVSNRRAYAVWEITLRCNLACAHCGSRAGSARDEELTTSEALDLVAQLADVGISEVTLIGGEAFLRRDWLTIAAAISNAGMTCTMTTGGYALPARIMRRMADAGISHVSVSIDGLEKTHDGIRGRHGSWKHCFATLDALRTTGITTSCNTQLNRLSVPEIPQLYELLLAADVMGWQVQLTAPMGNAAEDPSILLQPSELLIVFPMLARVAQRAWRDGMVFLPSNNVGYFGPFERLLRSNGHPWGFWQGPRDGRAIIGIESDGSVKADPTLPSGSYIGGNVRSRSLQDILENAPELNFLPAADDPEALTHLWGFCAECEFAPVCRGGSPWTAHVFFGRHGNNPYCHHRALTNDAGGIRERLVRKQLPQGQPYDHGVFEIVEEHANAAWPAHDSLHLTADAIVWPALWPNDPGPVGPQVVAAQPSETGLTSGRSAVLMPRPSWNSDARMLQSLLKVKRALDHVQQQYAAADCSLES